jgi:hypothetical protein
VPARDSCLLLADARTILITMDQEIHIVFQCRNCGSAIWLPHASLGYMFGSQWHRKIDAPALAFPCSVCNHLETYSLHGDSPFHRPLDTPQWDVRHGETWHVGWLKCGVESCTSPLPLFEQQPKTNSLAWEWKNLRCPNGHAVPLQRPRLSV